MAALCWVILGDLYSRENQSFTFNLHLIEYGWVLSGYPLNRAEPSDNEQVQRSFHYNRFPIQRITERLCINPLQMLISDEQLISFELQVLLTFVRICTWSVEANFWSCLFFSCFTACRILAAFRLDCSRTWQF